MICIQRKLPVWLVPHYRLMARLLSTHKWNQTGEAASPNTTMTGYKPKKRADLNHRCNKNECAVFIYFKHVNISLDSNTRPWVAQQTKRELIYIKSRVCRLDQSIFAESSMKGKMQSIPCCCWQVLATLRSEAKKMHFPKHMWFLRESVNLYWLQGKSVYTSVCFAPIH